MRDERANDQGGHGSLEAAVVALLMERGMEAFTLAELAARAGVPEDEVGRLYASEEEAIAICLREVEARFLDEIAKRLQDAPPEERLRAIVEGCVTQYDWTLWIDLWSLALREEWAAELRLELDEAFRSELVRLIRAGQASGAFAAADARRAAVLISCLLDGFATQATLGDSRISPHYMHRAGLWFVDRLLAASLSRSIGG